MLQYPSMRLSPLQRYILLVTYSGPSTTATGGLRAGNKRIGRALFNKFYEGKEIKKKDLVDAITKTLERLIDKGLLVGYGVRTPKKWYIKEVRLTPLGRKLARKLQGEQQELPLRLGK